MILFEEGANPVLCLVPSIDWLNKKQSLLIENDYKDKKSKPEWGVKLNKSNIDEFKEKYSFEKQVEKI